jgi:hypothetical protein
MRSHLSPRRLRAWAEGYQSGACIVRQAQDRTGPEYIRPYTVPSRQPVTPAALEVHNNVRWCKPHMGMKALLRKGCPCLNDLESKIVPCIRSAPGSALYPQAEHGIGSLRCTAQLFR